MGTLHNETTGDRVLLRSWHVFGRNAARSDTCLSSPSASLLHATLRWRENRWEIYDHSRNGTYLDGRLLRKGAWAAVQCGQHLQFELDSPDLWRLIDGSPPAPILIPVDGDGERIVLAPHNLLPDPDAPELSIYQQESGGWMWEAAGEAVLLEQGDLLMVAGREYRFAIHEKIDETIDCGAVCSAAPSFMFLLSLDEEHAKIQIRLGRECLDLGEREHHYLLATLARRRLADAAAGIDSSAQGWVECAELARMLGMEISHLNIQVYRARNQITRLVPAVTDIVERRRGSIRLSDLEFEISRGSRVEGRYRPGAASATEGRQE